MPGVTCCVPGCYKNALKNKEVSFHRFPKDVHTRKIWVNLVNRRGPNGRYSLWEPQPHDKICGIHFNLSGKRKKGDLYPKYNLKDETTARTSGKSTRRLRSQRSNTNSDLENTNLFCNEIVIGDEGNCNDIYGAICKRLMVTAHKNRNQHDVSINDQGHIDHNYCCQGPVNVSKSFFELLSTHETEINELKHKLIDTTEAYQNSITKIDHLQTTIIRLEKEKNQLEKKLQSKGRRTVEDLAVENMDNDKLQFYTGFADKNFYENFTKLIRPGYLLARKILKDTELLEEDRYSLSYDQQLLMVLIKLRLGLLEKDLAYRFEISQSTVSRMCNFWLDLLATQLTQIPIWPSKSLVQEHAPENFKENYPKTRIIIDCTEIFIEKPNDYNIQCATFSSYKHHNTAKGLLGITPNGFVSFVSSLYCGRTSDKVITIDSGLLDLLEEGDDVMADRGFTVEKELEAIGVSLNMPPLKTNPQMSEEENVKTRQIATHRVHIERVIQTVKTFRILKYIFPNSMHSQLDNIWKVCCYLCNFINLPLLDRMKQDDNQFN